MIRRSTKARPATQSSSPAVGRRELMKMGVGAGVGVMTQAWLLSKSSAQVLTGNQTPPLRVQGMSGVVPGGPPYVSPHAPTRRVAKYGWKNTSGRSSGNGPMDDTSRKIVSYVKSFSTKVTDEMMTDIGRVMLLDTIGAGIAGFETDSARAGARFAKLYTGS